MTWSLQPQRGHIPEPERQRVEADPDPCLTCRHARPYTCAAEVHPDAWVSSWVFAGLIGACENQTQKGASDVRQSD